MLKTSKIVVTIFIILMGTFISFFPNQFKALRRDEACCQWVLLNVQISSLPFTFTVQKYIYPFVNKLYESMRILNIFESAGEWTFT